MTRVKSIAARNHRKTLAKAKGFKNARSRRIKAAKEAVMHAGQYAYVGRRLKRRDLKSLWIMRLNAALRENGETYSKFMPKLKKAGIEIDKKILADIAATDPDTFKKILAEVK